MLAVAFLVAPALTAPVAAAEGVTLQCTTSFGTPNVIECDGSTPVGQGHLRCESPGLITSVAGVFTVAPAQCTGTGSTALITGDGKLTAETLVIDSNTGTVSILTGSGTLSMTQPQTGSSASLTCEGTVAVLTVIPLALHVPSGSCDGEMTTIVPGVGTAESSLECAGSAVSLTSTPFALLVPAGSCVGELTVTVPGVGTARITGETGVVAFTIDPVPVLTVVGPSLTVEVSLLGGATETVGCSAVTVDFGQNPLLTIPQTFCTTT